MQLCAISRPQLRIREAGPTDIDTALEIARRPTAAASLFLFGWVWTIEKFFFIIVLTPAHNVEQCSSKVYSISTYFSGPHRPRSRRNSSVRPFEAFELWFLENIHTQKYLESKVLRHSVFYLNGIDKWLRNAREVLLWCVAGLKSKQLKRN